VELKKNSGLKSANPLTFFLFSLLICVQKCKLIQKFKSKIKICVADPHHLLEPEPQRYAAPVPSTFDV
jgi:hypothetical protein